MMNVLGYTKDGFIRIEIDGMEMFVPDDPENAERRLIIAWEAEGNTIPPYAAHATVAEAVAAKIAELDAYRWEQEIGGFDLAGMTIRTDANSQAKVAAAYTMAKLDPDYAVPVWEAVPGTFVSLSNDQLIAMGNAVRDHVQDTFNRKTVLHGQIAALGTFEALEAFDITAAWGALSE